MKSMGKVLLIIAAGFTVAQSCQHHAASPFNYQAIWRCHKQTAWQAASIRHQLIGRWAWKYVRCCGETNNPYENGTDFKELTIELKGDGTGVAKEGAVIKDFTWTVHTDQDIHTLTTEPHVRQLSGQLLFCDDLMMCNASFLDGEDHFFQKTN